MNLISLRHRIVVETNKNWICKVEIAINPLKPESEICSTSDGIKCKVLKIMNGQMNYHTKTMFAIACEEYFSKISYFSYPKKRCNKVVTKSLPKLVLNGCKDLK